MTWVRSKVLLVSMQRGLNMNREREEGKSKSDRNISGRFVSLTSTLQEEQESLPFWRKKEELRQVLGTHNTCVARMLTISERISNGTSGRFGTWNLSGQCSKRPLGRQLQVCCRWGKSVCFLRNTGSS